MNFSEEILAAYVDGELDAPVRERVEAAMAADPEVARRVARYRSLVSSLRSAFDPVLEEQVPPRLSAAARRQDGNRVVPLRPRSRAPHTPLLWGALAAGFVLGAVALRIAMHLGAAGVIFESGGQLLAQGTLEQALTRQLVAAQTLQEPVRIGVSFRSKTGQYCRSFQVRQQGDLAGVACREGDSWKVAVLAQTTGLHSGHPEFRPAGSALPPAIVQSISESIAGEPLDAAAEAQAREAGWHPSN